MKEETKTGKRIRWFTCDVCGHQWRSYGYGERVKCPKCYEQRTGHKMGLGPERMAEIRAHKNTKLTPPLDENVVGVSDQHADEPKKSGFFGFLNKELF